MADTILTPHKRDECREAGVLGRFLYDWPDKGELGEMRKCDCGRWWRCSSPQWQRWDYLSPRKLERMAKRDSELEIRLREDQ